MVRSLNGKWECCFPDGSVQTVEVPGCWDRCVEEKDIAERVIFRKKFYMETVDEKCYRLHFEAVSYYCDIFLNGRKIGAHEGMWDSFSIDTADVLQKGENELVLEVWKPGYHAEDRFPLREVLSGFIPDVLCTFGGIWDDVWLESSDSYFVERHWGNGTGDGTVEIYTVLEQQDADGSIHVTGEIRDGNDHPVAEIDETLEADRILKLTVRVDNVVCWNPDAPVLYHYHLTLNDGKRKTEIQKNFGFREIKTDKTAILLNQSPVYLRGVLHWGYYDEIIPMPSEETIREEIQKARSYGFNMIKHCLYIPRKEYLSLADEMGMLLWVELPLWLPEKTPELEKRIRREYPRLMEQIAGHPSVIMVSLGCELDAKVENSVLEEMYYLAKEKLGVLVRDNSGSGECYDGLTVDYADFSDYHFYADLQNMENLLETFTPVWKRNRPWVFGEFCDSDTLRDMKGLREEKNVEKFYWEEQDETRNPICILKPDFFLGEHDERMEKSGIRKEFPMLKRLSYNHSMVHRKTVLEQTRSVGEISGYNITTIRDVPIATSGIFDDFMREKFEKETFRAFNQDVMLLPAWDLTRIWINADRVMSKERYGFFGGESYGLHLLVSNYGGKVMIQPRIVYELQKEDGQPVISGELQGEDIENGQVGQVCYLYLELPEVMIPETNRLKVRLQAGEREIVNEWPVFLYPKPEAEEEKIGLFDPLQVFRTVENIYSHIEETNGRDHLEEYPLLLCSMLTPEILEYVENGGSVFYVQRGKGALPVTPVAFWREGMIRKYEHPVMDEIRYENWMDDLRYFGSATDTAFSDIEDSRFSCRKPILRRYDCREWRSDDYLMELGCGKGKILATTLRIEGGMGKQPLFLENNRFGRWLIGKAIQYLLGK